MQYMRAQIAARRHAGPRGDRHRRDLDPQGPQLSHRGQRPWFARRPIWFGGMDRSEASMAQFYAWLGPRKSRQIKLAVMDMWKPFRNVAKEKAPQAAILFDKFHILRHLGEALDKVRKAEYARLSGKDRRFIKGQKYTLLSRHENLTLEGKRSLEAPAGANKRLNTAYVLKESFGQLWDYEREGWARRFFDNWRASLKWQRLEPYERFADMIDRHWDGIAAYCKPENKVSLGFVEGLNNKIRVFQRRAYGLRDEEYLRLKVLSCMLPPLCMDKSNTWCPRLTAAMILSGSAVHVKGFGNWFVSATKRLMAAWRSTTDRKTPRFNRRLDSLAKYPSTAFSQEQEVGVKWKTNRSCLANQACTLGCLWAA